MTESRRQSPTVLAAWVVAAIVVIVVAWLVFFSSTDPENRTPLESPGPSPSGELVSQPAQSVTNAPDPSPS